MNSPTIPPEAQHQSLLKGQLPFLRSIWKACCRLLRTPLLGGVVSLAVLIPGMPCQLNARSLPLHCANQSGFSLALSLSGAWSPLTFLAQSTGMPQVDERSMFGGGMKAVGSLLLVLSIILLLAFLSRRYVPSCLRIPGKRRLVQIVETVSLGDKRSLTLVTVGSDRLLLGCTPNSISVLKSIQFQQGDADQATASNGGESEVQSLNQASETPEIKRLLHSLTNWWSGPKQNPAVFPGHKSSATDLNFDEIMDQKAEESGTMRNESSAEVITRLVKIRRDLQAR